jgi:hypothetical protein
MLTSGLGVLAPACSCVYRKKTQGPIHQKNLNYQCPALNLYLATCIL